MADFRKLLFVLIAGALLFTAVASAQPFNCVANAVPTLVRSEGIAEMMGDVLLVCDGTPTVRIVANVRLRLTQNITSDLEATGVSEALLVLDEGASGFRATSSSPADSQNVYQAVKISEDEIEWTGVVLFAGGSTQPFRTIRLTNVRGNAQAAGSFGTVFATVNITSPTSVPVTNAVLRVADTRPGLSFSVTSKSYKNCESPSSPMVLKFAEGFASAFKKAGISATENINPGGGFLNESGFNPYSILVSGSLTGGVGVGQATQGTRLMARFKNIPSGVTLSVPYQMSGGSGAVGQLVDSPSSDGSGGTLTVGSGSMNVPSSGLVVWEITASPAPSYASMETLTANVTASYSLPGPLGSGTVNGNFAPISTTFVMSSSAPEPRFIDTATDMTIITISPCRTILLFPYVTNQAGFDTGLAISNTSSDPLGTINQTGACAIYYYGNTNGSTAPSMQTSPSVVAGGHLVWLLSGGGGVWAKNGTSTPCATGNCIAPLFQGYIIAICDFQFAHGYAFISDYGASKLAQGYLALIIPDRTNPSTRLPQDNSVGALINHGEQLGN